LIYYFANKSYKIEYDWKKIITIAILTALMYFTDDYLSFDYGTNADIISKISLLILFILLLKLFGFFTKDEIRVLKRLIFRK